MEFLPKNFKLKKGDILQKEFASKRQPVAITGMGIVCSAGEGIANFRDALFHGKSNFTRLSYPLLSFPVLAAAIQNFSFSQTQHKIYQKLPQHLQVALIAALETWQQANITQGQLDPARIGIVAAAQNTTSHYQYNLHATFQKQPEYLSPSYALHFMDTDYIGVISEALQILGEGFTVGGASASGNVALLRAAQLIWDHSQDACLVVGALADLSPMELQSFYNLGVLGGQRFFAEPNKACRPFDQAHDGFIHGQAAACLMLESLDSAVKRQARIHGYMLGGSLLLDGNRLSNPSREGEIRAMQKAMQSANITVNDIDYINTHGTSAPLGDQTEIEAIESLFSTRSENLILNSTKSITGHCLWSAGVVEAIATLIQMQEGFVHPTLNLENSITEKSYIVREKSQAHKIQTALSNSFGFGGINTTVVLANKI